MAGVLANTQIDNAEIFEFSATEIRTKLCQSWIEVQNGLNADRLFITSKKEVDNELAQIQDIVDNLHKKSGFVWHVHVFCVQEEAGVEIYAFYKYWEGWQSLQSVNLSNVHPSPSSNSAMGIATYLWHLDKALHSRKPSPGELSELKMLTGYPSPLVSTYAADIMTRLGLPVVPALVARLVRHSDDDYRHTRAENSADLMFEDKIDVCAYNFFEAVHPSYSKQTIVTARFIKQYCLPSGLDLDWECIDVGSGPGLPLLMLLEMFPHLNATAIEPSKVAYKYLRNNLKLFNDSQVKPVCEDFLKHVEDKLYPLIVSTGASHHFNTHFFFQKAYRLLSKGGVLVVADEFISKYESIRERKLNLIKHHSQYMLEILPNSPLAEKRITDEEHQLMKLFKTLLPKAAFYAQTDQLSQSEQLCRRLLKDSLALNLGSFISHEQLAFYRLMLLELEAMVAGLDYQVEQKTYPERLLQIASLSGFQLLSHERAHATYGHGEWDAGTHVFAFSK